MISLVFSLSIILFSTDRGVDFGVRLLSLIGGEALLVAAFIIFGRANGVAAYDKTILYDRKRALGSVDEPTFYGTGEYRLWKGFLIGFIVTVPFIIVLIIQLAAPNTVCKFMLIYVFCWAYSPVTFLNGNYDALSLVMIILPVGTHALGYYLGKLKAIKVQQQLASQEEERKSKRKRK